MIERCSLCPVPDGSSCFGLMSVCEQMGDPETRERFRIHHERFLVERGAGSPHDTEFRRPVAETLTLLRRMKSCPDRTERADCGCAGLATCGRGKGRDGLVNNADCFECLGGKED